jgi:photosystem II stability/assembly factor-like uncharacterized protein
MAAERLALRRRSVSNPLQKLVLAPAVAFALVLGGWGGPSNGPADTARIDVNSDFEPVSFTAIGERTYWVLGRTSCSSRSCLEILRTTDRGRSFVRIQAPPLRVRSEGDVLVLRFADRHDGFAFAIAPGMGGVLYATHDGGASWHRVAIRHVLAFATGRGNVYAVTARCSIQGCASYRLELSRVSIDAWAASSLPFVPDSAIVDLTTYGSRVWLLGTSAGVRTPRRDALARSTNGGRTFDTGPGPCYPGLGGGLAPVSVAVIWAVCPTGMLAGALRSTDGGLTFTHVDTPALVNSAVLAPASRDTAVLAGNGAGFRFRRTTNGGVTWTRPELPATPVLVTWMGFTDSHVGAALVQTRADTQRTEVVQELWRTEDAGARWSRVYFG